MTMYVPAPTATMSALGPDVSMVPVPLSASQSSLGASFEAVPSSRTTPTPAGSFSSLNGNSSHQYYDSRLPAQPFPGAKAQIYTAVYSGIHVYEMEVNGVAVMRRRNDSWLNATQILKLAGIDKGKRTKVLEREVLAGEHEKVQGGYGKYQGTWVSYDRGVRFAQSYGVGEHMRPLLEYDMGQDGHSIAGSGSMTTPTKEQAMAAQRKRNMLDGGRSISQSSNGTFFKNLSKSAANAVNAISKARTDSPLPRTSLSRQPSSQLPQETAMMPSSHLDEPVYDSKTHADDLLLQALLTSDVHPMDEPPRKRARPDPASFEPIVAEEVVPVNLGLPPLRQPRDGPALDKQQLLSSLFFDPTQTDFSDHPALQRLSGEDLDIPIDQTAHTALHWAATLARTSLLRALTQRGASIYRLNGGGETALIRAALTTNNLDQGSFPELLEILGPSIEVRDGRGRTVLHHIAVSSAVRGPKRSSACRYYLESLLEYVVRSGGAKDVGTITNHPIGLARFMSDIVNATDMSGDTALNLAARIGNKSIIQQLLEVGANPTIANRGGLRPVDFGVAGDAEKTPSSVKDSETSINRVMETSQELVECESIKLSTQQTLTVALRDFIATTSSSFKAEMTQKQSLIEATHTKLRESTALLAQERRRWEAVQRRSQERRRLREQMENLRRANHSRYHFSQSLITGGDTQPWMPTSAKLRSDIRVGEADAGLEIDCSQLPLAPALGSAYTGQPDVLGTDPFAYATAFADSQRAYLSTLPSAAVLRARSQAYRRLNAELETSKQRFEAQSNVLESRLRKVVSLCTGVEEDRVDQMIGALGRAVESEQDEGIELGRVREFLRKVESEGGGDS